MAVSLFRLVLDSNVDTDKLVQTLVGWLALNSPGFAFALAELANPGRAGGNPRLTVAIEDLAQEVVGLIRNQLADLGDWNEANAPDRLHIGLP